MNTTATPSVSIRILDAQDRPLIETFFLDELDDDARFMRFFRTMTPATLHAYVEQMRFDESCTVFGAFENDRLVGVAELSATSGSEICEENRPGALSCAELGIAISNRLQKRGVGRSLLGYLLEHGWTRGLLRIQLSSLKDNRPMLILAERLGFQLLREEPDETIMQILRPENWPHALVFHKARPRQASPPKPRKS